MAWIPLSQRLPTLPLVLAGPILRRVEKDSVSVWIALKESRELELIVYDSHQQVVMRNPGSPGGPKPTTVSLGKNLHILVITAKLPASGAVLKANETYQYAIVSNGVEITTDNNVTYWQQGYIRPTFSLPPSALDDLRIVHGSCRKMHAPGEDAFVALDMMLEAEAKSPTTFAKNRPHQLFLTGDQIYADDVDGLQLFLIQDACNALLGWEEEIEASPGVLITKQNSANAARGARATLINNFSGFKFPLEDSNVPANHLIFLGEYYCMYLLMWSPVLWPNGQSAKPIYSDYPKLEQVYSVHLSNPIIPSEDEFVNSVNTAVAFQKDVALVRRALANTPTYMICDDHEITDDWFITFEWTRDVLSSPLGTRILQNGLTAYALFQAWGNTPQQFEHQKAGGYLLDIMPNWELGYQAQASASDITLNAISYRDLIYLLLGLPDLQETLKQRRLIRATTTIGLTYNYQITWDKHEVIVFDTRNERAFTSGDRDPPILISDEGLAHQLGELSDNVEVTIMVIPTPVSGIPNIEGVLDILASATDIYFADGEVYSGQPSAVESLYGEISYRVSNRQQRKGTTDSSRIIVLSGDVHYGFTNRVEYWGDRRYNDTEQTPMLPQTAHFVLAQFCASALKNEKGVFKSNKWPKIRTGTDKAHIEGYTLNELENGQITLGWVPPINSSKVIGKVDVRTAQGGAIITRDLDITKDKYVIDPYETALNNGAGLPRLTVQPDWQYSIKYIVAKGGTPRPESVVPEVAIDPARATPGTALAGYLAAASNAQTYATHDGYGREAVGKNNIGEVRFSWGPTEQTKIVTHQLWWRLVSRTINNPELLPYPLSEYEVILGSYASKYQH